MPVYTYVCDSCGVRFDRHQKFTDPVLTRCPECNKKSLRKVFQPVGIVFKGSGFYATDHRSPSGQTHAGSAKNESGDSAPKSDSASKSDSTAKSESASSASSSEKKAAD